MHHVLTPPASHLPPCSHAGQQPAGGLAGHGGRPRILLPGGKHDLTGCCRMCATLLGRLGLPLTAPSNPCALACFAPFCLPCAHLLASHPPIPRQDVYPRMTGRRPLKTPAIIRALFPAENIQAPRVAPMAAAAAPLGGGAAAGAAAAGGGFGGGMAAEGPAAAAAADGGGDGHMHAE